MNFLDKTGLAHFWSKIKSYIENKKYISSKDGSISNIISITYEEYKKLEDLGKLDPDTEYHIIDAQSTIGDMEEFVSKLISESDKKKHPIGSLEFNVSGTNPSSYLGFGTWELWGAGKVPVGVDTTQTEFNTVEKNGNTGSTSLTTNSTTPGATGSTTPSATTTNSQSTTNTSSVSNIQPYITCYMWKRTA